MSDSSVVPAIPPNIAELTGPLFLGHLFNWALFGALSVQVYVYYIAFPKDLILPKAIVAVAYILEVLQTCLSTYDSFRNFGTGWGDMRDLDKVGLLWFSVPVLGAVVCCIAQLFYAWRVWILGRQWFITSVIVLVAMVQLCFGIYGGVKAHLFGVFSQLQVYTFIHTTVWLGSAALDDIIIAITMTYYLWRSNTGLRTTRNLIVKIIRLTVETGAVCAAFAILDLAFYLAFKHNNFHLAPSIPLSKLYSNSLLVVLNSRVRIVGSRTEGDDISTHSFKTTASISFNTNSRVANTASRNSNGGIAVTISQQRHRDDSLHIPMDVIDDKTDGDSPSLSEGHDDRKRGKKVTWV